MNIEEIEKRDMKAAEILAIRLELEPEDILWEGIPDIDPVSYLWRYTEVQRDEDGSVSRHRDDSLRTKQRTIVVPPELYQEFLNHMEHGVPGE